MTMSCCTVVGPRVYRYCTCGYRVRSRRLDSGLPGARYGCAAPCRRPVRCVRIRLCALGTAVRCVPSVCSFPCCPVQLVPWLPGIVGRGPGRFVGIRAIHLTVFTFTRFSSLARHRPSHPCKPRYSRTALPRCPMKTSLSYTKDVTLCRCLLGDIQLLKKACNHVRKWEDEWHSRPTWGKPVAVSYAGLDLRMISV